MTLEDWGWTDFFAEQFTAWSDKGLLRPGLFVAKKTIFGSGQPAAS